MDDTVNLHIPVQVKPVTIGNILLGRETGLTVPIDFALCFMLFQVSSPPPATVVTNPPRETPGGTPGTCTFFGATFCDNILSISL